MSHKALLVSEDYEQLRSLALSFRKEPFSLAIVETAEDARSMLTREPIGALIIDENIRSSRGIDLLVELAHDFPQIPRVFASGEMNLEGMVRVVNQAQVFRILRKPWDAEHMAQTIRVALRKHSMKLLSDRVVNLARRQTLLVEELDRETVAGDRSIPSVPRQSRMEMPLAHPSHPSMQTSINDVDPVTMLTPDEASQLSRREKEILRAVVSGKKPRDLARIFFISVHTSRNHIKSIYRKLGVHAHGELIAKVLRPAGTEQQQYIA
jgi:DNA-binding NarL/FixJ family response regulator